MVTHRRFITEEIKNLNAKKLIIGKIIKLPYFAKLDNCKNIKKINKKILKKNKN